MLKRTFIGCVMLFGASAAFVAILFWYVWFMQPRPAAGADVTVQLDRLVSWPWEDSAALIVTAEPKGQISSEPPAEIDLVLLVDVSGSMLGDPIERVKAGAIQLLRNIGAHENSGKVTGALVTFSEIANPIVPLTSSMDALQEGVWSLPGPNSGGTRFIPGLNEALEVLRNSSNGTVVMLTDGLTSEALSRYYRTTWRPVGHELFLVGVGQGADYDALSQLTDNPAKYVITRADQAQLGNAFKSVAKALGGIVSEDAWLSLPLSHALIEVAEPEPGDVDALSSGLTADTFDVAPLFERRYEWQLRVQPRFGGVVRVLHDSVSINYVDAAGNDFNLLADQRSPILLAITPWMLLLLILPGLLYLLSQILTWLGRKTVVPEVFEQRTSARRETLPLLLRHPTKRQFRTRWSPTLVVGLGGASRHVLNHVKQAYSDSFDENTSRPVLLHLDVEAAVDGDENATPGCLADLAPAERFVLPARSTNLVRILGDALPDDDPREWLRSSLAASGGSREQNSLTGGSRGDARRARLALLNELAQGQDSALLAKLEQALEQWRNLPGDARERQILLVVNVLGGVGRGWLTDLVVLLRRLVTHDEQAGYAVELSVILFGPPSPDGDPRYVNIDAQAANTLLTEIDRLASAGRVGFSHHFGDSHASPDWMRGEVVSRPQDRMLVMSAADGQWDSHLFPTVAGAVMLWADADRRRQFSDQLEGLRQLEVTRRAELGRELYTQLELRTLSLPRSFLASLLRLRLTQTILSDTVLFPGLAVTESISLSAQPQEGALDLTHGAGGSSAYALMASVLSTGTPIPATSDVVNAEQRQNLEDASNQLIDTFVSTWNEQLARGEWNLLGLAEYAHEAARNLRNGTANTPLASIVAAHIAVLESIAKSATTWIALCLGGDPVASADDAEHSLTERPTGWLVETGQEFSQVLEAFQQASAGQSRVVMGQVSPERYEEQSGALLHRWLRKWLEVGESQDPLQALRSRVRWTIELTGIEHEPAAIRVAFYGTERFSFDANSDGIEMFRAALKSQVNRALDLVAAGDIFSAIFPEDETTLEHKAAEVAQAAKGTLRGDLTALLVDLPHADAAVDERAWRMREALRRALADEQGAADIIQIGASADQTRISAMNLAVLRTTPPLAAPEHAPQRYDVLRYRYQLRLAQALGHTDCQLPNSAGIALANGPRLLEFAYLWQSGSIGFSEQDERWHVTCASDRVWLTFAPFEVLADAAARYVRSSISCELSRASTTICASHSRPQDSSFAHLLEYLIELASTNSPGTKAT